MVLSTQRRNTRKFNATYVWVSRDGPQAGRYELASIFALSPEHGLLHVGYGLEGNAKHVQGPANVVLKFILGQ